MRPYRLVFSTLDRDGNEVRLVESQWLGHILTRHPEMEPYLEEIRQVIQDPQLIAVRPGGERHFLTMGAADSRSRQYLKVVVGYLDDMTGRRSGSVRTAFFTERYPKEVIIYERGPG